MTKKEIINAKKLLQSNGYSVSKNKLNLIPKSNPENNLKKGMLGCKDDCIDYPDCHPTCRVRWYHK